MAPHRLLSMQDMACTKLATPHDQQARGPFCGAKGLIIINGPLKSAVIVLHQLARRLLVDESNLLCIVPNV